MSLEITQISIPLTVVEDVTASRAINGTFYHNSTGKVMILYISILYHVHLPSDSAFASVWINGLMVGVEGIYQDTDMNICSIMSMSVPANANYSVVSDLIGGGTTTLQAWIESY